LKVPVFISKGHLGSARFLYLENETLILFEEGDHVAVSTEDEAVRFLLISGKPLKEPVAWQGPIVMNTQEELKIAFEEYRQGTFVKHKNLK